MNKTQRRNARTYLFRQGLYKSAPFVPLMPRRDRPLAENARAFPQTEQPGSRAALRRVRQREKARR